MMIADGLHIWHLDKNTVYKGDSHEAGVQGRWIVNQDDNLALPKVYRSRQTSYDMEALDPLSPWTNDSLVFGQMILKLTIWFWGQPPVVTAFAPKHLDMIVNDILGRYGQGTTAPLGSLAHNISWDDLPRVLTHGNCTFDNVMVRPSTREMVLISPQPATFAVPDMRAVDFGRILQSIMGFEAMRYSDETRQFNLPVERLRAVVNDDNEWRATVFWCVVHLLRCLPRTTDQQLQLDIWKLIHNTIKLGQSNV
jgi:hypothetical protein